MSSDDYVKFLTQKLVKYIDTPKNERKASRAIKQKWTYRWFGLIPMSLKMIFHKNR
jgi:hypothetical protein